MNIKWVLKIHLFRRVSHEATGALCGLWVVVGLLLNFMHYVSPLQLAFARYIWALLSCLTQMLKQQQS